MTNQKEPYMKALHQAWCQFRQGRCPPHGWLACSLCMAAPAVWGEGIEKESSAGVHLQFNFPTMRESAYLWCVSCRYASSWMCMFLVHFTGHIRQNPENIEIPRSSESQGTLLPGRQADVSRGTLEIRGNTGKGWYFSWYYRSFIQYFLDVWVTLFQCS